MGVAAHPLTRYSLFILSGSNPILFNKARAVRSSIPCTRARHRLFSVDTIRLLVGSKYAKGLYVGLVKSEEGKKSSKFIMLPRSLFASLVVLCPGIQRCCSFFFSFFNDDDGDNDLAMDDSILFALLWVNCKYIVNKSMRERKK